MTAGKQGAGEKAKRLFCQKKCGGTSHLLVIGVVIFPFSSTSFLLHGRGGSIGAVRSLSNGSTISPRATPTAHTREEDVVRGLCAYVPSGDSLYLFVQVSHLFALDARGLQPQRTLGRSSNPPPPPAALASHRLASLVLS